MTKTIKKLSIVALIASFSISCFAADDTAPQAPQQTLKETETKLEEAMDREAHIQDMVRENDLRSEKQKLKAKKQHARNEILKTNCTRAKSRLEDLMTNDRILIQTKQGQTHTLSQKEKLDEIQAAELAIKKYCTN